MKTITNQSSQTEEFNKDKIEGSIRGVDINQETTRLVVADIKHHKDITTSDVWNLVIGAIKNKEPQAAKRYESHPRKSHKL
ncbi:MAG: hypothetical protein ABIJ12_06535 [bacterium]